MRVQILPGSPMNVEPIELVCQMVEELGYKTKAESNLDGTLGVIWVQKILSADYEGNDVAPYITVMEIEVRGAILECKCDSSPVGTKSNLTIDLHEPNSVNKLKIILEHYEKESRINIDDTMMKMLMIPYIRRQRNK